MELKRTPLYELHKEAGAVMKPFSGYEMPIHYGSIIKEHLAVRKGVGLFDVSHMCKFLLSGEGSLELCLSLFTNDASRLQVGDAQYTCMCDAHGGIIDDAVLYRLGKTRYMLVANAGNLEKNMRWLNGRNLSSYRAQVEDITASYATLALQGKQASDILLKHFDTDLAGLSYYKFRRCSLSSIENVMLSRNGYTGAGGFELYLGAEEAKEMWKQLLAAGVQPCGLGARDSLRLEMGYCLYGKDIDEGTTPLEAGLDRFVAFDHNFTGHEALKRQKVQGIQKCLVRLAMPEDAEDAKKHFPREGYPLLSEQGHKVGEVTSGGLSISSQGRGIALGYVATNYSKEGQMLAVEIRNVLYPIQVLTFPLWKKKNLNAPPSPSPSQT